MSLIGGELDQLAALRSTLSAQSGTVASLITTVRGQLDSTYWRGPAADRFRAEWHGRFERALHDLEAALAEAAAEVGRRAEALRSPALELRRNPQQRHQVHCRHP